MAEGKSVAFFPFKFPVKYGINIINSCANFKSLCVTWVGKGREGIIIKSAQKVLSNEAAQVCIKENN